MIGLASDQRSQLELNNNQKEKNKNLVGKFIYKYSSNI